MKLTPGKTEAVYILVILEMSSLPKGKAVFYLVSKMAHDQKVMGSNPVTDGSDVNATQV